MADYWRRAPDPAAAREDAAQAAWDLETGVVAGGLREAVETILETLAARRRAQSATLRG